MAMIRVSPAKYTFPNSQLWAVRSRNVIHPLGGPPYVRRMIKKKKTEDDYWKIPPEICIVGVSRIRDSTYSSLARFLWFCTICICSALCFYQLWNCTKRFLEQPVIKNVEIKREPHVQFPAVYICPAQERSTQSAFNTKNLKNCKNTTDFSCFNDPAVEVFKDFLSNFTKQDLVEKAWNLSALTPDTVKVFRPCKATDTTCTIDGTNWEMQTMYIHSFWGRCLVLNTFKNEEFRGPFTYFTIIIKNSLPVLIKNKLRVMLNTTFNETAKKRIQERLERHFVGVTFYLHEKFGKGLHHILFFNSQDVFQGFQTHVEIRRQQFEMKDRRRKRCVTEESNTDCINRCLEEKLFKKCRMPYDYSVNNIKNCTMEDDFREVHIKNNQVYSKFNPAKCSCLPMCRENKFTSAVDVIDKLTDEDDTIRIKFYFADNTYESTVEKINYDSTAFLSDVGGNLGFFLGFCILNILEVIEFLIYLVTKKN